MAIHVYNTMSRQVELLEFISPGKVGIYVCGPTVYDDPHLGHARSAVVFDVITRYLRAQGHAVTYVRNITDIDDKIIEKARQRNQDVKTLGGYYANRYHEAMRRLNVPAPDAEPKATEYILPIQDFIAKLIQGGHAYESIGSVYFSVESFRNYGGLSGRAVRSLARPSDPHAENGKKQPADFVLWKKARPEEPSWPSPWGNGRPGWHIECSAMSAALLGRTYDIHGGGLDLVFPHHENEIAQSESLFGKTPANCWMHNGLVFIEGEKMSKSLGNVLNLHELLERYQPEALRLFLLSKQYRRPIEFSHAALTQASGALRRLQKLLSCSHRVSEAGGGVCLCRGSLWSDFCKAMDQDFNIPLALSHVFAAIRSLNRNPSLVRSPADGATLDAGSRLASELCFICRDILGLVNETANENMPAGRIAGKAAQPVSKNRQTQSRRIIMSEDYRSMWQNLGLDLVAHDALLGVLGKFYRDIYLAQKNRPEGMAYFDFVMNEVHGLRIKELVDEQRAGRKVIGSYCVFVPEEIVLAGNATLVGLCAGADFAMDEVEKILPRNTCALIKSTFGFKLGKVCPYLEASDMIVGENTCDGKKKAYESLGPLVSNLYVMDIPQMKSGQGRHLLKTEYRRFKEAVEKLTGVTIDASRLKQAIEIVNNKRKAIHRLSSLRHADPAPISGLDALLANQVFFYDNPQRFTDSVNKICDELQTRAAQKQGVFPAGTPRILLSGCPMAVPNWKLPWIVETSGAVIVGEESCVGERGTRNRVNADGNTVDELMDAIVDRYFQIDCAIFTPNPDRLDHVEKMVKSYKADGVIHYGLQFCQPYLMEAIPLSKALEDKKIPTLRIETDYSMEDVGQLKTRVEAFIEMLK